MIEISQIKLPCGSDPSLLEGKIRKLLRLSREEHFRFELSHHSVDARKKPVLYDVYSVRVELFSKEKEKKLIQKLSGGASHVRPVTEKAYSFPEAMEGARPLTGRPVIIGFGPAGLFCALELAKAGYRPIVLERGQRMEDRIRTVEHFFQSGELNPESNIQFGEGGAGTFSDGKLTSNVKDKEGRVKEVLSWFLWAGAPEDIAYEQIPHIGTDRLRGVILKLREEIERLGGEIRFETCAERILIDRGEAAGVKLRGSEEILRTNAVVLAPGHSARDTIRMLSELGVPMEAKNFAVGFRVSHPQALINEAQYGISDPEEMKRLHLAATSYKLTARAKDGHGVYSFCMCPGGYIVNASSEPGRLAVNGMSDYQRDAKRANSAIVMTVGAEDFGGEGVLDGLVFQEKLEEKAFRLADGKVPVQRFSSFEEKKTDTELPPKEELCIKGEYAPGALHELLPSQLSEDFAEGMHQFGRKIKGFDQEECYVVGLESRTSSPVRILRGESGESVIKGLYPCGEGAGYAGGIMSAAVDGIRTAEWVAKAFCR